MTFPEDLAKLAYEASAKSLAAQTATVDNARTRFGVLLGGGNIATAFLAKDAITRGMPVEGSPDRLFLVGTIAFAVFALACLYGLLPKDGWVFDLTATSILAKSSTDGMTSIDQVHTDLALWNDYFFDENIKLLGRLWWAMWIAAAAILIELAAFLAVVGGL